MHVARRMPLQHNLVVALLVLKVGEHRQLVLHLMSDGVEEVRQLVLRHLRCTRTLLELVLAHMQVAFLRANPLRQLRFERHLFHEN